MTQKTRADYKTGMATTLPDNSTGEISPADLRAELIHLIDSALLDEDGTRVLAAINAVLDGMMVRRSPWDPTSGAFPAGAQNGYLYRVTGTGTVDSVSFFDGDFIVATTDDASTATMAANWELIKASPDRYATTAQGAAADSAVQPEDLDPTFTALAASRSTTSADNGVIIESTAAGAVTLTVETGHCPRGFVLKQNGAGQVTIAAGAGVTINRESDVQALTNAQHAVISLVPDSTADTFTLTGSLAAV